MSTRTRKSVATACDRLWANVVKVKANGRCERCGMTGRMESHHAAGRTDRRLRWAIRNGVCLDHACHRWAESFPLEFAEWFLDVRPADAAFIAEERRKGPYGSRTLDDYLGIEASLRAELDAEFPSEVAS